MNRIQLSILLLALLGGTLNAQPSHKQPLLKSTEERIEHLFERIRSVEDDHTKISLNDSVLILFREILPGKESFRYPFNALKYAGKLYPPDSTFRIINWNLAFSDGTYHYYGFICLEEGTVTELHDHSQEITHPEDTLLTPDNWYGALYYCILENRWRNRTWYTLLGIDLHNTLTTRKIIDILSFDKKGNIHFGAPLFDMGDSTLSRVLFEFNARVSMLLHYDEAMEMIVFDHLSPAKPAYKGIYQYYGPDSSYDGFFFFRGMWRLREDLDVRNRK
jgi:hypothetical protein